MKILKWHIYVFITDVPILRAEAGGKVLGFVREGWHLRKNPVRKAKNGVQAPPLAPGQEILEK